MSVGWVILSCVGAFAALCAAALYAAMRLACVAPRVTEKTVPDVIRRSSVREYYDEVMQSVTAVRALPFARVSVMSFDGLRLSGRWLPADGFDETLTIFDLLCDAKPGRRAAGAWKTTLDFGGQVHRGLMEPNRADALELLYDRRPELLERACLRLGGTPMAGADVSFSLPFFEELRIAVQFWHGDDEFAPRLRILWDANADQYLRYETMYYAIGLLKSRLRAYGGE